MTGEVPLGLPLNGTDMTAPPETLPPATLPTLLVRHGVMRFLGEFAPPATAAVRRGDTVVIKTERGTEVGEVLCPATPPAMAAIPEPTRGDILRVATADDRSK